MASSSLWQRFQQYFLRYDDLGFSIDISRMKFPDDFFEKMGPKIDKAFAAMRDLEAGGIANPDEKRMVGHYWLRKPSLAPNAELRAEIEKTDARIKQFAADDDEFFRSRIFQAGVTFGSFQKLVGIKQPINRRCHCRCTNACEIASAF